MIILQIALSGERPGSSRLLLSLNRSANTVLTGTGAGFFIMQEVSPKSPVS